MIIMLNEMQKSSFEEYLTFVLLFCHLKFISGMVICQGDFRV